MSTNDGINISFDMSKLNISDAAIPAMNAAVDAAISTSLLLIRDRWQQEAQARLHSTRTDYLLGLSFDSIEFPYNGNPYAGAIILRGKSANAIEQGWSAFDMKIGFSQSKKIIPTASGGWFLTIPIRHSVPGSFMYGRPMPPDIYAEAKKLQHWGSISVSGGIKTSWTGYRHKANIYDKLTRIMKQYPKSVQSQYYTFRRVSNKSDPLSWWHPGYPGVHIARSLEPFAQSTFKKVLQVNISQVFNAGG